ncbi:MAG: OmpA family protein [Pseudomonadales bacterium]|nr:OmpA family protein [Pseudomonadales bacterium]
MLLPKNYERAREGYQDAEQGLERGRDIDYIRKHTKEAEEYFKAAAKNASLAQTVFAPMLKSRQDALSARALTLSPDLLDDAERKFQYAIRNLERGKLGRAKDHNIEATSLYRDAELVAIKAQYLTETRNLIRDADDARIKRYAPITLQKAKDLLAEAEQELSQNRYDADRPRSLARQANYEVKHAFYLAKQVKRVDDEISVEQLVLEWEDPLNEIAGAADIVPSMSNGHDELQQQLVDYVESMRSSNQSLEQQLVSTEARLNDMETQLRVLDDRLGGETQERVALMQRLEAEARVKAQFKKLEKIFTSTEARVFRERDDVILRLVGLTFDSGASYIRPAAYKLLEKVEDAVGLFPDSKIVIEGHTDSYGGDEMNYVLSQDRAVAVQQYMVRAMSIPPSRLSAMGYGETRPVANNETRLGRQKNRRIDIVIRPNFGVGENQTVSIER